MVSFWSGLDLFAWTLAQPCPGSRLVKLRGSADLCARTYGVRKCGLYDFLYISSIMQGEYIGQGATVCGLSHAVNKMRTESAIFGLCFFFIIFVV